MRVIGLCKVLVKAKQREIKLEACFSGAAKRIRQNVGFSDSFFFPIKSIHENFFFPLKPESAEQEIQNEFHFPILIPSKNPVDPARRYISRAEINGFFGRKSDSIEEKLTVSTPSNLPPSPAKKKTLFGKIINIFSNDPQSPEHETVIVAEAGNQSVHSGLKAIAEIVLEEEATQQQPVKANDDHLVEEILNIAGGKQDSRPSIVVSGPGQSVKSSVQEIQIDSKGVGKVGQTGEGDAVLVKI